MDAYNELLRTLALTMGASWASGINLYAALLVLGIGGATGNIALPQHLVVLQEPIVIGAAGIMYCVEFFADKTPGVDTAWDTLHTFIRIPAGAMLAANAVGDVTPALQIAAGIMGGSLATASHASKTGSRMLINASPEPFTNWAASISEDLMVLGGLWTALHYPVVFLALLVVFIILVIWLLPKIWRLLKTVLAKIGQFLGLVKKPPEALPDPAPTAGDANRLDELERLQRLRESGALTDEEFEKEKGRILGQTAES